MTTTGMETKSGRQDYHSLGLSVNEKATHSQSHFQTSVLFSMPFFRNKISSLMVIMYLNIATLKVYGTEYEVRCDLYAV